MPAAARTSTLGPPPRSARGFTLVELVVTIAVGSVVVAFMALFIVMPMNAYTAQTRRAALVDASDSALRFMARDLRSSLPNSVRITSSGTVTALELLATADGARYQDGGPLSNPALALNFAAPAGAFATTVPFTRLTLPWSSSAYYLSIYNVGVPGANAYQMANVITPAGTAITISAGAAPNQNLVTLSPAFQFAYGSPEKRVYLVSGPVSYLCDTSAGTLTRYSGYTIASTQSDERGDARRRRRERGAGGIGRRRLPIHLFPGHGIAQCARDADASDHPERRIRAAAERGASGEFAMKRTRGFALIPALFLIVVLGALALVAIRVGTGQQQAVIMSLQQARALAAAQAGIEWGAYQAVNSSCVPSTTLEFDRGGARRIHGHRHLRGDDFCQRRRNQLLLCTAVDRDHRHLRPARLRSPGRQRHLHECHLMRDPRHARN